MTTTEAEKVVREACIAANPEIMEFKFGCLVKVSFGDDPNLRDATLLEKGEDMFDSFPGGGDHEQTYVPYEVVYLDEPYTDCPQTLDTRENGNWLIIEIIGRPIRLADVMNAIYESDNIRIVGVSGGGRFLEWQSNGDCFTETEIVWNMLKDLSDQSDETKLFLAELLSN